MYLIVLGAGPVGTSLVELALRDGHDVALIEPEPTRAQAAAERYDCLVLQANIAQGDVLQEAEGARAAALIATTEDDSANLMAMFLGAEAGVDTLISVVNHQHHRALFERLGAQVLVDPEVIVAQHLYGLLRQPRLSEVVPLPDGGEVFELVVEEPSPLRGKALAEAGAAGLIPQNTLIVLVRRGGKSEVPSGKTVLKAGDRLTVFSQGPLAEADLERLSG